jgi:hypothetical protein
VWFASRHPRPMCGSAATRHNAYLLCH